MTYNNPAIKTDNLYETFCRRLYTSGWKSIHSTPNSTLFEKKYGVPLVPAVIIMALFALIGLIIVLVWLALKKKTRWNIYQDNGIAKISSDDLPLPITTLQDFDLFLQKLGRWRIGYIATIVLGIISMIANGILLGAMMG